MDIRIRIRKWRKWKKGNGKKEMEKIELIFYKYCYNKK